MRETIIHDDGTEPTVIKRWCCDGRCEQGRFCPGVPAPAEACTDIGVDDAPETIGTFVLMGVLIILIVAFISFFAGYWL